VRTTTAFLTQKIMIGKFSMDNFHNSPLRAGIGFGDKIGMALQPNLDATKLAQKNLCCGIDGSIRNFQKTFEFLMGVQC
jgi:hypothetical protein